jgi:hypothetical protein
LLTDLAENLAKKLPRYPNVPAVRMGRLAVDQSFKGKGLGAALLADALRRAATAEIAAYAFVVDAKDESAAEFYTHHGFFQMVDELYLAAGQLCQLFPLHCPAAVFHIHEAVFGIFCAGFVFAGYQPLQVVQFLACRLQSVGNQFAELHQLLIAIPIDRALGLLVLV